RRLCPPRRAMPTDTHQAPAGKRSRRDPVRVRVVRIDTVRAAALYPLEHGDLRWVELDRAASGAVNIGTHDGITTPAVRRARRAPEAARRAPPARVPGSAPGATPAPLTRRSAAGPSDLRSTRTWKAAPVTARPVRSAFPVRSRVR